MFRRVLASAFFAVLVSAAAALAQAPLPLLTWTAGSGPAFLSLDEVQAQVDATLRHAAASKVLIAAALAKAPPVLLTPTPVSRR